MELKLFVDDKSSNLLFAEADKGFVDFLFSILALPLGTVTRLLQEDDMLGSIGALYKGVESISNSYLQPGLSKETVLCPKVTLTFDDRWDTLLKRVVVADRLYKCGSCDSKYVCTSNNTEKCPTCGQSMYTWIECLYPSPAGYVKDAVTYMVMDDLEVKPMSSTISVMSLLKSLNIKDVGELKEQTVTIDKAKALQLLRASLVSKTVLTDVFLSKIEVIEEEDDDEKKEYEEDDDVATSALPIVAA